MRRNFRYRLYPNRIQRETLDDIFWFCRFLYNSALQERISHYKKFGKGIGYNKQAEYLPEIKAMFPKETAPIYAQVLQQVLKQLDKSYENFFRRVREGSEEPGFPRFKGEDRFRSICFPQVRPDLGKGYGGVVKLDNGKLKVFGLPGELKIKWHRSLQSKIKQVRIIRKGEQYYISFSCADVPSIPLPKTGKTIAVDLGLNNFITTDDGTKFHHPKPWKTAKQKIAYLNQELARKQRGSKNRRKTKSKLTRANNKVANIRDDWQHKTANDLIKENDIIIVEDLNIKNMMSNEEKKKKREANKLAGIKFIPEVKNENISDAAWGNFVAKLIYKAESAGRNVIQVDPKNTSKTCSCCGNIKLDLKLSDRIYHCDACGICIDRDINAAINIKKRGINPSLDGLGMSLVISKKISEACKSTAIHEGI